LGKTIRQVTGFFEGTKAVYVQFVFLVIIISGYAWILTDSDIVFFDTYVLPSIVFCHPDNFVAEQCEELRRITGCEDSLDQLCIGEVYWRQLNIQAWGLASVLFLARIVPSIVLLATGRRKFRPIIIIEAFWWAGLALIIFMAGIIDYGYYTFRGLEIPETLDWLNQVGLFQYTKTITGDPLIVERADLYITLLIGVVGIVLVYLFATAVYKTTRLKTLA